MHVDGKDLKDGAEEAKEEAKPWVRRLARLGYAANGVVYAVVGFLALRAALGPAEAEVGREEALAQFLGAPLGQVMLAVIAVALVGYSAGHVLMGFRSPEKSDKEGLRDWVNRGAHIGSGLLHLSLAAAAAQLVISARRDESGRTPEDWTAIVMAQPLGRWLVGLAGLGLIGIGVYELYKVVTAKFRQAMMRDKMSDEVEAFIVSFGRVGYTARGIIYGIMGVFLIQAARQYEPQEAGGLGQALGSLAEQPYGPWLLGAVAIGFIAFGGYAIMLARYRDFDL
jgi:hypothetical protein